MGFFFSKIIRYAVFAYILFSGAQFLLRWKSYGFSPKEFRQLASKAHASGAGNGAAIADRFSLDLKRAHPSVIPDPKWVGVVGGGMNLQIQLLHSTLTEYVALIHAPFATQGRSGMHWSNSTCTVLSGSVDRVAGDVKKSQTENFKAGGNFRHGQFESYIYTMAPDTFVACYGRGVVPLSLSWTLPGTLAVGDPILVGKQLMYFGEAYFHSTFHVIKTLFEHYKNKAIKQEL